MGGSNSKTEKTDALRMCKERKMLIKQAMDSRYGLAAAHIAYIQSLRNIGIALRRFAEAEVLMNESSLSPSASAQNTELDKTPSHSSYPSPSPSNPDADESPARPRLSYMRSGAAAGGVAVTVRYNPATNTHSFVDDDEGFPMPPPPPPPPGEGGASWDYFDAVDQPESFRFVGVDSMDGNSSESIRLWGDAADNVAPIDPDSNTQNPNVKAQESVTQVSKSVDRETPPSLAHAIVVNENVERCGSKKVVCPEREDPSEFITHRAKDFLSSIKDIEHRFFRASEAGKEVGRMLEGSKIRVGYAEAKGRFWLIMEFPLQIKWHLEIDVISWW